MIKQNKTKNRNKEEQITEQTRDAGKNTEGRDRNG